MKKFTHTGLWEMLPCTVAGVVTAESDAVLDEFTLELHEYCRQEKDLSTRIRTLRFARTELSMAQERRQNGEGGKCLYAGGYTPCYRVDRMRTGYYRQGDGASRMF